MSEVWQPPASLAGLAELDLDRMARRGYPEAVFCEGKTPAQVATIGRAVADAGARTLFTRASTEHAVALRAALPGIVHHEDARLLA